MPGSAPGDPGRVADSENPRLQPYPPLGADQSSVEGILKHGAGLRLPDFPRRETDDELAPGKLIYLISWSRIRTYILSGICLSRNYERSSLLPVLVVRS